MTFFVYDYWLSSQHCYFGVVVFDTIKLEIPPPAVQFHITDQLIDPYSAPSPPYDIKDGILHKQHFHLTAATAKGRCSTREIIIWCSVNHRLTKNTMVKDDKLPVSGRKPSRPSFTERGPAWLHLNQRWWHRLARAGTTSNCRWRANKSPQSTNPKSSQITALRSPLVTPRIINLSGNQMHMIKQECFMWRGRLTWTLPATTPRQEMILKEQHLEEQLLKKTNTDGRDRRGWGT